MEFLLKKPLFDTHFHPDNDISAYEYYKRASDAGIRYLIAVGSDMNSSELARQYAESVDNIWFAAGIHPHEASLFYDSTDSFEKFMSNKKCVAVGEIGLDYFYETSERNIQLEVFEKSLAMALRHNLPAIVHCRDRDGCDKAYSDAWSLLSDFASSGGRFTLHCYTGTPLWAEKFLEIGGYLGFTGIVTFPKGENVREIVRMIPEGRMLIETDTPYLTPVPVRGKKNHTEYLPFIASRIAQEREISLDELALTTTRNAGEFFSVICSEISSE